MSPLRVDDRARIENRDIVLEAPADPDQAHVEEIQVDVADGLLTIELSSEVQNPRIEGIEILDLTAAPPVTTLGIPGRPQVVVD